MKARQGKTQPKGSAKGNLKARVASDAEFVRTRVDEARAPNQVLPRHARRTAGIR